MDQVLVLPSDICGPVSFKLSVFVYLYITCYQLSTILSQVFCKNSGKSHCLSVCSSCYLVICMSIIWICVISHVCLAGCLSCVVKTLPWISHTNCSTSFCHTCHAYRHHGPLPFHATFTDLDLAWPFGFIFSYTVHLIRMKFDVVMK